MAEMCDSSRECQATRSRANDGEKDYAGMRDMQRKFIDADHELRALKEKNVKQAAHMAKQRHRIFELEIERDRSHKDLETSMKCQAILEKRAKSAEAVCSILRTDFDVCHLEEDRMPVLGHALRAHEKEYPKRGNGAGALYGLDE